MGAEISTRGPEAGTRRRFVVGLIGGGIATSFTPLLHEREADELGLSYSYQVIDIDALGMEADDVGQLLAEARRMGFSGVNVTHPCKQLVIEHLDALSAAAEDLGAVNTVVFAPDGAIGHNTDEPAFKDNFKRGLEGAARGRVVVLGAGGAGAAVAHAILALGAAHLTLVDKDLTRAQSLAALLATQYPPARIAASSDVELAEALSRADGLIHATPVGMDRQPGLPLDPALLDSRLWVADIVYRPLSTELLEAARERGCRTLDGGGMAVLQAARSFELFTGIEPDAERMFAHFTELVRDEARAESRAEAHAEPQAESRAEARADNGGGPDRDLTIMTNSGA